MKCFTQFALDLTPKGWQHASPFPNEETEVQRGQTAVLRPHSKQGVEQRLNQVFLGLPSHVPTVSLLEVANEAGVWGIQPLFLNPLTYCPSCSSAPRTSLLRQNLPHPPGAPEKKRWDRPLKKSDGDEGHTRTVSSWLVSGPFPRADRWKGQSFGPAVVGGGGGGPGQRKTVTQEPAEGISNKLLTSQFCCGCPVPGPVYHGNLGGEGMCVGGSLRVGAEGLKLGFLNPHRPRKQLQERTPRMVFCVCEYACKREAGSN